MGSCITLPYIVPGIGQISRILGCDFALSVLLCAGNRWAYFSLFCSFFITCVKLFSCAILLSCNQLFVFCKLF